MFRHASLLLTLLAVGCFDPPQDGQNGLNGVSGEDGRDGRNGVSTLVVTAVESPGENCEFGGVALLIGADDDGDGRLTPNEIDEITYVCSQRVDGDSSLVELTSIDAGPWCPGGGTRIQAGVDRDRDGVLDPDEVDTTSYVCNGEDGSDGSDGVDGNDALIRVEQIPAEPGGVCYFGGIRVLSGTDDDNDGLLDASEVDASEAVCRIQTNEYRTLVESAVEPPGASCAQGGVRMDIGYDSNGDGALDASEIDDSSFICNEIVLIDGESSLIDLQPAGGNVCPWGGTIVRSGLDGDRDGSLAPYEVEQTEVICNGSDGYDSLVELYDDGGWCGLEGGYLLQSGLDLNFDGQLALDEVTSEGFVCNGLNGLDGIDGFVGYDGLNSLVRMDDDNGWCGAYGGLSLNAGLDWDQDGYLDTDEIDQTEYVCNGLDGLNTLIEIRFVGYDPTCGTSGLVVESGLDWDEDGVLDWDEVEYSEIVCDGLP